MTPPNGSHSSNKSQTSALDKIALMFDELERSEQQSAQADALSGSDLARALFGKAPSEFLERKSVEDLLSITSICLDALSHLQSHGQAARPNIKVRAAGTYLEAFIAISDRPFIVNSAMECMKGLGISIRTLLHPILSSSTGRVSLSYLELETSPGIGAETVRVALEQCMADLMLVSDDFMPMLVRAEGLARLLDSASLNISWPHAERRETAEFLRWIADGALIFLGHAEHRVKQDGELQGEGPTAALGVFKSKHTPMQRLAEQCRHDVQTILHSTDLIKITKLAEHSPIQRRLYPLHIAVKEFASDGSLVALHSFVGLLTSKAISEESSTVPVVRTKVRRILDREEIIHNSHDYKYVIDIVDSMPKDEALRIDEDSLRDDIQLVIEMHSRAETKVSARVHDDARGVSFLVIMPRERFNSEVRRKVQEHFERLCGIKPGDSEYFLDLTTRPFARFYFYMPLQASPDVVGRSDQLVKEVLRVSRGWRDNLAELLEERGDRSLFDFLDAFGGDYQALNTPATAEQDIQEMLALNEREPLFVALHPQGEDGPLRMLSIYSLNELVPLRVAFPVLQNAGIDVIQEHSSEVRTGAGQVYFIHRMRVSTIDNYTLDAEDFRTIVAPGLRNVFRNRADNDRLNALMLRAGLALSEISVLRAYISMLWQISRVVSRENMHDMLAAEPALARQLYELFEMKFDPKIAMAIDDRRARLAEGFEDFRDALVKITALDKDRVLRSLALLVSNTVRTNAFTAHQALAFKLHSESLEIIPMPRPKFEIYVLGPLVEGVHLRVGMVSRGGIRWSDRPDDFRSEILSLVKTQNIKNAVIVPQGAKGGFIVRNYNRESDPSGEIVREAYRQFIRSLLSLTDNRINQEIRTPDGILAYDGEDPYLVVAADKGTAAFSDIANGIAVNEFKFWLGDAFASGGSNGYDHKKYGITARGAWECIKRLFHDRGIDHEHHTFTAVGIGDMSGDVFGNGLLLSSHVKLLAAFDHRNVFIDPEPDAARSFEERSRVFALPRSSWLDYNAALMSDGGAIFGRFDKEVTLSAKARKALAIPPEAPAIMTSEEIVSYVLRAPVDLFFNGGIGTYVKASYQSHPEAQDGTNDRVRINANEMRARVVGEGGNLGFTQQARIEYAEHGGSINTDAIDNSGGVDLSDHEVNLKILFAGLLASGKMTIEERNQLLVQLAPEVVSLVLEHNRSHAVVVSIATKRSVKSIGYFQSLIRMLHKTGIINRHLEVLPDDDELQDRISRKQGLERPEIAVCTAAVKMWIKQHLLASELLNDPLLDRLLLNYFPGSMREKFKNEILAHPLRKNIIATEVANRILDAVGVTFVHRMCSSHGATPENVIKCLLAAETIFKADEVRQNLWVFDNPKDNVTFIRTRQELGKLLREATNWLISYHGQTLTLEQMADLYAKPYSSLLKQPELVFVGEAQALYLTQVQEYETIGLPAFSAQTLSFAPKIQLVLEILWAAKKSGTPSRKVAEIYGAVIQSLSLLWLLGPGTIVETASKWDNELVLASFDEIRRAVAEISLSLLKKGVTDLAGIQAEIARTPGVDQLYGILEEFKASPVTPAALTVFARQVRSLRV